MPKKIDPWSWSEMSFERWRRVVNEKLKRVYLISIDDAGIDDAYLKSHWENKEAPYNFVEWYTLKYDLEPKSSIGLGF